MSVSKIISCEYTYIDGASFVPALIRVENNKIAEVVVCEKSDFNSRRKEFQSRFPQHEFSDLKDKLLTPAFVNAHTHCTMSFFRSLSVEESTKGNMVEDLFYHIESHLKPEDVRAFTRFGAVENILNGVGLVWDHYYEGLELAEAFSEVGLPAVVAPTLQDLSGPGLDSWQSQFDHTAVLNSSKWTKKNIYAAYGPHATDTVSESLWHSIVEKSKTSDIPLHFHLAQSKEEYQRSINKYQSTPLQWIKNLGVLAEVPKSLMVHGIYLTEEDLKSLGQSNHVLGYCPHSQLIFDFPAAFWKWQEHKIPFVIATDCVASNDSMNLQKELRLVAGMPALEKTFKKEYQDFTLTGDCEKLAEMKNTNTKRQRDQDLLATVFKIPGDLHPKVKAGRIAEGSLANFLVWDRNHPSLWPSSSIRSLVYTDSMSSLSRMMIAGQWLGREDVWQRDFLKHIDYKSMLEEGEARLSELKKRCGLK